MSSLRRTSAALALAAAVAAVASLSQPTSTAAFTTFGFNLPLSQRDFRVFNNFTDASANNNLTADPNFPGALGAVMAIWKGHVEWGSGVYANGFGDPHQPGGLGSGGANFDNTYQGEATGIGGLNDNIHSEISSCGGGGTFAFTESPNASGWRVRYCGELNWADGPGTNIGAGIDLQGVAAHQVGHTLGLGHSSVNGATMATFLPGNGVSWRSISTDDINGVKAIYGAKDATKPVITGLDGSTAIGQTLVIDGSNFTDTDNEVWFTKLNSTGQPTKVTGVASTGGGTQISVTVPADIQDGEVLVKKGGSSAGSALSNAWPFAIDCGIFTDLGNGLAGTHGEPSLAGTGSLCDGELIDLALTNALENATAYFCFGTSQLNAPLKGGVLVPDISAPGFFLILATDAGGKLTLSTPWPAGLPVGFTFVTQYWIEDALGPEGFSASNAIEGELL